MIPKVELELIGLDASGPSVVAVGGGRGLAQALSAVQAYAGSITAVVGVADDGGSSGRLAPAMGMPPPGDLRKSLLALSVEPSMWSELFAFRFDRGDVAGHSLGNLILAALTDLTGDFSAAMRFAEDLLHAMGRVVPVALTALRLSADKDGRWVSGQVAVSRTPGRIRALRIEPDGVVANPEAIQAIYEADQIVLAPGSLYTSVIATLMVPGIAKAIDQSLGALVYVQNLVTQDAETLGMTAADHVAALAEVGGLGRVGTMVAHAGPLEAPDGLEQVVVTGRECGGWTVALADVADHEADWPQHDPLRLGRVLSTLEIP